MIKVGSWNIRGLNDPRKQVEVRRFILEHHVSLMGVVETKVRHQNFSPTIRNCLPYNWDCIHNIGNGVVARILFA